MHWSPQVSLMQAICDAYLLAFSFIWIYRYDRFVCLMFWRPGWRTKLFQRVMLIGYVLGFPFHIFQCIALAVIKYDAGFYPMTGVLDSLKGQPVQYFFWTAAQKRWIEPINWMIVVCWSTEVICHWEEVFYWLFLLRVKPTSPGWFRSFGFRATCVSTIAVPALFSTLNAYYSYGYTSTNYVTSSVFKTEGVVSLAFSLFMIVQNGIFSFWIIPRFPKFLNQLEEKGATPDLLRRFSTFDTLNRLRTAARWLFAIPLFILAADSIFIPGTAKLNQIPWVVDLLLIGCYPGFTCSASLTLVIFLPVRGPYDHLAFSSTATSTAATSSSLSAGPYFDQPPTAAVTVPLRSVSARPPRRPTLPITNILRLPLARDERLPNPRGQELELHLGGEGDAVELETKAQKGFGDSAAKTVTTSSAARLPHPYTAPAIRRGQAMMGQTGFASTGNGLRLHPEILGFSSPRYDRFVCLRFWQRGWRTKLFQRVMLIGYVLGFPFHTIQCIALAVIKYRVGFYPMTGVLDSLKGQPVQYFFWTAAQKRWIEPINWLIVVSWSTEVICRWEEVFYWLFLLRLKPNSPGWFRSFGFRATCVSTILMPALFSILNAHYTYAYKSNDYVISSVFKTEGVVALAFSSFMIVQNGIFSFWIIPRFPKFVRRLEMQGASPDLLRRFSTFDGLNRLRTAAQWLFAIPIFVLAADNIFVPGTAKLNQIPWVVDLFLIGCYPGLTCSRSLTLVVFLPVRGPYDHLAFSSSAATSNAATTSSLSPGPFFDQPPTAAVTVPLRSASARPPRRPTLPITNILRLPLSRDERLPTARGQELEVHLGGEEDAVELETKAQAQVDPAAKTVTTSSARLPHPYTAPAIRRGEAMMGQTGFASTGNGLRLHPEILGFSSPIEIQEWSLQVQASVSAEEGLANGVGDVTVEIREDEELERAV
ncbi:hypothetical protein JCM8547_001933 [Rhodosporidiobolus lusitaniae]